MRPFSLALLAIIPCEALSQPRSLTLDETVRLAREQSSTVLAARQALEAVRYRNTVFNARLRPQLSVGGSAVGFERGINAITSGTGETRYVSQSENQSNLRVTMSQQVRQTGGSLSISSQVNRIDLFGNRNAQFWQTTPILIGFTQAINRPNPIPWNEQLQIQELAIADRQFVEAREDAVVAAVGAFFDLLTSDIALANAVSNVGINDTITLINRGRFERGSITERELLQTELALLRASATAEAARLNRDRAEGALRRLLSMDPGQMLSVVAPQPLDLRAVDPEVAARAALANGSFAEQIERDMIQAKRQISDARLNAGYSANLSAMVGFNQTGPAFFDAYSSPLGRQRLSLQVDMPLVQWGAGRAEVQAGQASLARLEIVTRARREEIAEEARFAARRFMQSRSGLDIAAKADSIAALRYAVSKAQYDGGNLTLTELLLAQSDKDAARESSAQALRTYWTAYHQLRRMTLYDFIADRPVE